MPVTPAIVAEYFAQCVVPNGLDVVLRRTGGVCKIFLGAQFIAPVHQMHFGGDVGKIERFLRGGIAAPR